MFEEEFEDSNNDNEKALEQDVYDALNIIVESYMKNNTLTNEEAQKRYDIILQLKNTFHRQIQSLRDDVRENVNKLSDIRELMAIDMWAKNKQLYIFEKSNAIKSNSAEVGYQIRLKEKAVLDFVRNVNKTNYLTKEEMAIQVDGHPDVAHLKLLKDLIDAFLEYHVEVKWMVKQIIDSVKVKMEFEKEFNLG